MSDLIERLRSGYTPSVNGEFVTWQGQCREAADRIEALEAERAKDHANINLNADFIEATMNDVAAQVQRIADLEDRLKAADALADAVRKTGYRVDHNGTVTLTGMDAMIPIHDALAAYREASK